MRVLVCPASGRTGQHVIAALRQREEGPEILAVSRSAVAASPAIVSFRGDMEEPASLCRAMKEADAVIYYGPGLNSRETAMGIAAIDAAVSADIKRFIFISVIHPQIDDLMNHKAKLAIEAYLINSGLNWTILRPQHYMQNIDVTRVIAQGCLSMPYDPNTTLGHVDMLDLAEAAAKVAVESGHDYATYDISSNEHLSVRDICAIISETAGKPVEPSSMSIEAFLGLVGSHYNLNRYAREAFYRLFGYYERNGISGNANVVTWLLGRPPTSFTSYVERCL